MVSPQKVLSSFSDLELIERYTAIDDKDCIGELFHRYSKLVFTVCIKYLHSETESQDASMQIFEKLLVDLKKHSISNFRSWLHTVSKNHCLMELRKNKGIYKISGDAAEQISPIMEYRNFIHQEDEHQKEIKLVEVENALIELTDEQRICVELFYLKEKSYQEISELTGFTMNNVKSFIQNGKRNLKIIIAKNNVTNR